MLVKTDKDTIQSYFEDASGLLGGHADYVHIPESEKDIQEFLRQAATHNVPVTISGGGTGVTGGRVPFGGSLLSLERMNRILEIRKLTDTQAIAVVQPGVVVRDLKTAVQELGWMYAPDPTEQNSFIGGNISTNASGSRGFKYGSTRSYVRRLRVVLTSGEILDIKRGQAKPDSLGVISVPLTARTLMVKLPDYQLPRIKNAAGYYNYPGMDLVDLFIGQEGTLGVVTEIEVSLLPKITKTLSGIVFFPSREDSWKFVTEVKALSQATRLGKGAIDAMSLEYFDRHALELLKDDYPLIPDFADAAIFFEQCTDNVDEAVLLDEWARVLTGHRASLESAWFATTAKDQQKFREFRHRLPEKVNEIVRKNKFPKTGTDIAVPNGNFRDMLLFYEECFKSSGIRYLVFGHIGESHMHANLLPATEAEFIKSKQIYLELVEKAINLGGTVSAEHGIGKLKHPFLEKMVGEKGLREMAALKKVFDRACILGRGNLFPENYLA